MASYGYVTHWAAESHAREISLNADTGDQLSRLAGALSMLERAGLEFGHWAGGDTRPDGSITMPYYDFSAEARTIIAALPVIVFDWPAWKDTDEGGALLADHDRVAEATPDQLVKLSTTLVRADRFTDGTLAWAFESGLLLAMARRARALTELG